MANKFFAAIRARFFNTAADTALDVGVSGDANPRLSIDAGGKISWGNGTDAVDTNIYRDSADVLKTDDTLKVPVLFIDGIEVDTTGATTDQVLKYNGTKFIPSTGSSVGSLNDLSDVVITTPLEFQTLEYNGTNWVNANAQSSVYVRNAEATTITTGTCVYLFGATGDHATVKRADHNSDATSAKTVGVVSANILASENGVVVTQGYVDGIDLSVGYTAGDVLWLGEAGAFTKTKPTAPDHLVFIGVVVRATNNGIIYVATQNGYELDELHNVSLPSPQSGEFLKYNGSLWVADAIDLGTDTTGNYVGTITAGTGIATSGASTGEGIAHSISLAASYGDTQNPYASKTANYVLAAPNGTAGVPTFRAIVAADIPTLNQNTTGTAATVTGAAQTAITSVGTLTGLRVDGNFGIGASGLTQIGLRLAKNIGGSAFSQGIYINGTIQTDATSRADSIWTSPTVAASATLPTVNQFYATLAGVGSGSTVTTSAGFVAESNIGSNDLGTITNAYGFVGNLVSGTNRYNLFMNGDAPNYLGGRLGVGVALTSGAMAQITNTTAGDKAFVVKGHATQSGDFLDVQNSGGTSQFKVTSAGDVHIGTANNYGKVNIAGSAAIHHATPLLNFVDASNTRLGYLYHDATNLQLLNHSASGGIQLATNSTNRFIINSAGEVGIASSPITGIRLTVTGGTTNSANPTLILNGVSGSGALYFHNDMGAGAYNSIVTAGSKGIIAAGANSTTARGALVIAPWSDTPYGIRFTGGSTTDILVRGTTTFIGTTTFTPTIAADKALIVKGVASQAGDFFDVQDSAGTSQFKVTSSGFVGIATASPSYLLDIFAGALGGTAGDEIIASRVRSTNANNDQILTKFRRTADGSSFYTAQAKIQRRIDGSDQGYVGFGGGIDTSVRLGSGITDIAQFHPTFVSLEPSSYVAISTASAERMRIDSTGNLLLGTTTRRSVGASFQTGSSNSIFYEQTGLATGLTPFTSVLNRADSNGLRFVLGKSRGTTAGAVTALVSGDSIAELMFAGADGTTLDPLAARITAHVDGTVATGSVPGRITFFTTSVGASVTAERMRITNAGNVGIATTAPVAKLEVLGSDTVSSQNNVSGVFGTTTSGRLLLGSITGNTPFIGSEGATTLAFTTNSTVRMRIDSAGNVGIGTASPSTALQVNGTITATSYTGALASAVTATTQTVGDNSTKVATTAFVIANAGGSFESDQNIIANQVFG